MARKVEVRLIDDLDSSPADERSRSASTAPTTRLTCPPSTRKNCAGRWKGTYPRRSGWVAVAAPPVGGPRRSSRADREQNQAIREWAERKGMDIAPRGRIAQAVLEQYQAEAARGGRRRRRRRPSPPRARVPDHLAIMRLTSPGPADHDVNFMIGVLMGRAARGRGQRWARSGLSDVLHGDRALVAAQRAEDRGEREAGAGGVGRQVLGEDEPPPTGSRVRGTSSGQSLLNGSGFIVVPPPVSWEKPTTSLGISSPVFVADRCTRVK